MKKYFSFLSLLLLIPVNLLSQDYDISRKPINHQAIIYSLPRTSLKINIEVTKTIIKKGPYAEFANKYLGLTSVVTTDSEVCRITGIECLPVDEPDPRHYYGLNFKTLPSNLQSIYSLHNHGILLNSPGTINEASLSNISGESKEATALDPQFIEDAITERTDTFYKTIMNDTAFVRIPVFKKQIHAKTLEELAKETAHELTKTRKRRIKLVRGEYDFHPDAATLRLMLDEMRKQEEIYLQLFQGLKVEQKYSFTFNILPADNLPAVELGYFSEESGFSKKQSKGTNILAVHFQKNETAPFVKQSLEKDLPENSILYRVPSLITVVFTSGGNEIFRTRLPFYQFGTIQNIVLKLK